MDNQTLNSVDLCPFERSTSRLSSSCLLYLSAVPFVPGHFSILLLCVVLLGSLWDYIMQSYIMQGYISWYRFLDPYVPCESRKSFCSYMQGAPISSSSHHTLLKRVPHSFGVIFNGGCIWGRNWHICSMSEFTSDHAVALTTVSNHCPKYHLLA